MELKEFHESETALDRLAGLILYGIERWLRPSTRRLPNYTLILCGIESHHVGIYYVSAVDWVNPLWNWKCCKRYVRVVLHAVSLILCGIESLLKAYPYISTFITVNPLWNWKDTELYHLRLRLRGRVNPLWNWKTNIERVHDCHGLPS